MSRYEHLRGADVSTPPWDREDDPYCHDCGHTFEDGEAEYEDDLGNPVCGSCRERYPCRVCRGTIPQGIRDEYCSDECALLDAIRAEKLIEADEEYRLKKGD